MGSFPTNYREAQTATNDPVDWDRIFMGEITVLKKKVT